MHHVLYTYCSWCGSSKTGRSRVRWFQRWRTLFSSKRPHRCYDCGRRFWTARGL